MGTFLGILCIIVCCSSHLLNCTGTVGIYATHDFVLGAQSQCLKYACELHNIEVCGGMKYKDADAMAVHKLIPAAWEGNVTKYEHTSAG